MSGDESGSGDCLLHGDGSGRGALKANLLTAAAERRGRLLSYELKPHTENDTLPLLIYINSIIMAI